MVSCDLIFAVVFISVFHTITDVYAHGVPRLDIQPNIGVVLRQIDSSLVLTCRPIVDNPKNSISQLEWRDPRNHRIETRTGDSPIILRRVPEDEGLALIFSKLKENHQGNYTCSGMYSSTEPLSASVKVETYEDITFVDAPESQFARIGQDQTVKCKVHGRPTPTVEWSKNDNPIETSEKYIVDTNGLIVKSPQVSDDGVYKCTAIVLSTGDIDHRDIKLEVIIPPKILPMQQVTVIEGETASTKCNATGKPPPSYTWIKTSTSQDLKKTDRFDVREQTGDLIINRVEFNDHDEYLCVAENTAGRSESKVRINVLVKPKIYELWNVTAPMTNETKIICKAVGRPVPKVTFRKRGMKEPMKDGQQSFDRRITLEPLVFADKGESFGTLIISNLNRSDDGLYECIAENEAGTAFKNGHITVEFPPSFERTKTLPAAWAWPGYGGIPGRPGNITCIPEAIPNATVIWKHNGIELHDSPNFKIEGRGPVSSLIVQPRDGLYGQYECIAQNKYGINSIDLLVNLASIPGHVNQLKVKRKTATTITFEITPPRYFDGLPIKSIVVQYRIERQSRWEDARNHTWSFGTVYTLENLLPEFTYFFRFAAANDVGLGPFLDAPPETMPRRSEPAEPKIHIPSHTIIDENSSSRQDRIAVSPYADHFELRWKVPNNNGDPIESYLIRYCVSQRFNGEWRDSDCSGEIRQSVMHTSYELKNLKPDTIYKIELRAVNAIGASSPGQIRMKTARGIDPGVPFASEPVISSALIIGIVVASIILVLIVVDCVCFFSRRLGVLAMICTRSKSKQQEDESKLGRDEREPLRTEPPVNGQRTMTLEYDGRQVQSKPTGEFIGKHSAV